MEMRNRTAAEIMTRLVVTISPESDIIDAMHTLLRKKTPEAPVIDSDGNLLGMLSETDCLKALCSEAFHGIPEGKVTSYMSYPIETITPKTNLCDIVNRFMNASYRRIPVQEDDGSIVGQVSRRDVLLAFEAMRDNPRMYGRKDERLDLEDSPGVDRAMRRARAR
jgi:CBS-domain-containing membrane protein